jgi:hypothetical protein
MEGKAGGSTPDMKPLLDAITAAVVDEYDAALTHVRAAAEVFEEIDDMLLGPPALADCRRAIVAIERHIAIQQKRPVRRSATDGKSGG